MRRKAATGADRMAPWRGRSTTDAMTSRIVFHVGLPKTGTTSLQRFCRDNRGRLRRGGILYPRQQVGFARNHSPLVASYIAHRPEGPSVALRWLPRRQAVDALLAEIGRSGAATSLISSEHFSSHFDRSEARELVADFGHLDPVVVIALRDPHERFLSSYNTHVTAGGRLTIEAYAASMLVPGTRFMSARETVLIWQEAFGRDRIQIVDYDAEPDMIAAILGRCGWVGPLPAHAAYLDRRSLGERAIETLRCANEMIVAQQSKPPETSLASWLQLSVFSILCRRRIASRELGGRDRQWTLSATALQAIDALAEADRRFVLETYGLSLKGSSGRDRIIVGSPQGADTEQVEAARVLVEQITRGLWGPSRGLVALWDSLASRRGVRG